MNEAYEGTWPVFQVCLVLFPVGALCYWYATQRLLGITDNPFGRGLYWLFGSIGAVGMAGGGFFGLVAFVVLLFNGLSLWWLLIPGVVLTVALWRAEQLVRSGR